MADVIQLCHEVVDELERVYVGEDRFSNAYADPDKIVQTTRMAIWAQSTIVDRTVHLGLPSIRGFLRRLAASGPGPFEEFQGVRHKFARQELESRTTSPMSTLS
ncbi:hypothetical protein BDW62DRAFT_205987 [Aspergillus aurantiobrunneus]